MDLSKSKVDSDKEIEGVWIDFDDVTSFLIARYENPVHKRLLRSKSKQHLRQIRAQNTQLIDKLEVECLADAILLDWKGLYNGEKELKYSKEKALEILKNPAYVEILDFVKEQSADLANFYVEQVTEGLENVKKLSTGD